MTKKKIASSIAIGSIPIVATKGGSILVETTLERLQAALETYLWARRTGQWETVQMNDMASFAQEFFKANPALINKGVEEAISLIEKALKSEQKTARDRLKAAEDIKAHGAVYLHAIFDEFATNEIPTATLLPQYHLEAAWGSGKGKRPSKEAMAEAETQLREVVFDGEVFGIIPAKGARQEAVVRLRDAQGKPTGETVPEPGSTGGGNLDIDGLVGFLASHPRSNANAIKAKLNIDKATWTKLIKVAKAQGKVKQYGEKMGATYSKA